MNPSSLEFFRNRSTYLEIRIHGYCIFYAKAIRYVIPNVKMCYNVVVLFIAPILRFVGLFQNDKLASQYSITFIIITGYMFYSCQNYTHNRKEFQ